MNINRSKVEKRIGFRGIYLIADCNMKLILNSLASFDLFNTSKTVIGKTVTLYNFFFHLIESFYEKGVYTEEETLF